jgi:hypothetical protein
MFEADAAEATKYGWRPASKTWAGATLVVVYQQVDAEPAPADDTRAGRGEPPPPPRPLFADADNGDEADARAPEAPSSMLSPVGAASLDRSHPYQHDEPTGRCRTCGLAESASAHRGLRPAISTLQQPSSERSTDQRIVWLLVIIAVLVGVVGFWVIAEPHEQCYISDGGRFSVEYPIVKSGPDTYRLVPSQFRNGDYISSDAVIDCRWEFGS